MNEDLRGSPYLGYAYAYPHKTAYRPFVPPLALGDVWASEPKHALFAYLHVPFCEFRCGFCNLFTMQGAEAGLVNAYLDALARQAERTRLALGEDARFVRLAIGGGTPTLLPPAALARVLGIATALGADSRDVPTSIECSPATVDPERLAVLAELGIRRVSIGIQTFAQSQARTLGRPQRPAEAHAALTLLRRHAFPILNVDLMYGGGTQTIAEWLTDVDTALEYAPEQLYLYPLYVRPLTGLGRRGAAAADDGRLAAYRAARERLLARGYVQVSMRMFQAPWCPADDGPAYCCQRDGMVGLGAGARSYTAALHYATEYAVGRTAVVEIIRDYIDQPDAFDWVRHGFALGPDEQRRRFLIQSLLQAEGLVRADYHARFGSDALEEYAQLHELTRWGYAECTPTTLRLTPAGLERSDAIGPWLASPAVREHMLHYGMR